MPAPTPETMRCPRCEDAPLEPPGARTRRCARCGATWCARDALGIVLGAPPEHPMLALRDRPQRRTDRGCPACGDTWLDEVRLAPGEDTALSWCAACGGVWVDRDALPRLRALASSAPARPPAAVQAPVTPPFDASDRFSFDDPLVAGLAVPIALLVGLVVQAVTMLRLLASLCVCMPLHELGHATVAWFGSHYAMPLPFITFSVSTERSFSVGMALAALLIAALLLGVRERRRYLVAVGAVGLALQAFMTIFVSSGTATMLITWSGCGGEILLSTLLLVSYHHELPDKLRWDFFRFVALAVGAVALTHALVFWHGVSVGDSALPVGTALGGKDDANGDMDKLLRWGWSARGIAHGYLALAYAGLAIVAAHYALSLRKALRIRPQ